MKKLVAVSAAFLMSFSLATSAFAVSIAPWAREAYDALDEKHIIPVSLKGNKNLNEKISRQEFTELLVTYLMANKSYDLDKYKTKFTDCDNKFVNLASGLGIVNGIGKDTFRPEALLDRSQAAVMIYKVEELLGTAKPGVKLTLKDKNSIPKWALPAVESIVAAGAISGYSDNTFGPNNPIARQEAVSIIYRLSKGKSNNLKDVYDIEKDDKYLTKEQYGFILENLPVSSLDQKQIKQDVFDTDKSKKQSVYEQFMKLPPYTPNELLFSPNLVFDSQKSTYLLGLEQRLNDDGKQERRTVLITVTSPTVSSDMTYQKDFGTWFTIK